MAELTGDRCCATRLQASCCEPGAKAECCGREAGCGCDAGSRSEPAGLAEVEIRETHRVHAQANSAIIRARKLGGAQT
jgi:predicted transglutaminase-like cysteine proteinase